ncbi:MAG: LPS-assembly lipoprotein [Phenylobacterium sp.]|jgi:LPS-assembly lipoprotein
MSLKTPIGLILATLLLMQTGCGFKLRGHHQIPESLKVMHLDSADKYSELARLLRTQLALNNITLVEHSAHNTQSSKTAATLELHQDKLDRRTLSLFPNGQVAEYELIYAVRYAVILPEQPAQQFDFEIYRDYQDDPESALAKSKEMKLILREMRQQAADKIIRQLASLSKDQNLSKNKT